MSFAVNVLVSRISGGGPATARSLSSSPLATRSITTPSFSPKSCVRCAKAIVDAVAPLGIHVRAGVHTGEVETIDGKVGGIAVAIGARVGSAARPIEVLASSTMKDLTAGSGLHFEEAGEHELKGVPDRWHLYRVVG
jgi:class 3 adenylate cyclase